MKILYCGVMFGTSKSRTDSLKSLGNEVIDFDYFENSLTSPRWFQRLENFNINQINIRAINTKLINKIKSVMPDMLWVDKGTCILKSTLEEIKNIKKNIIIIHHCTDDVELSSHNFKNYFECLDLYDAHFTCNKFNIDFLKRISKSQFFYNELGYDHNIFYPREEVKKYDIFFIGHHEKHYEKYVSEIVNLNLKFFLGGPGWFKSEISKSIIRFNKFNEQLYPKIINQSYTGLGLYSLLNRNLSSGRVFEIPASKTALIVQRNSVIEELYVEDKEAIFFDNANELIEKIKFYSENKNLINEIAENGYNKCIKNKCSWENRIYEALQDLQNAKII